MQAARPLLRPERAGRLHRIYAVHWLLISSMPPMPSS